MAYYTQALPVVEVFPSERSDTSCGREYHPFQRWDIQRIFPSPKEEDTNPYASAYQTYEVSATVTDSKGETQEANYTFSVGESSIVLFTNLPPQIEKDSVKAVVEARTINGEMVSTSGTFKIVELIANRSDKDSGEKTK